MRHGDDGTGTARRSRFTRRALLGGATLTAAGAILAACGGNPDAAPATTNRAAGTTAPTTTGGTASTAAATVAPTAAAPRPPTSTPQAMTTSMGDEMPVRGGRLVIADSQADTPLDPFKTTWHSTSQFAVFTRYVEKAPDLKFIPHSFESWQASPDNKDVTFKVKPGIKFTDGTPLDGAAIKFNIDRFIDPARKSPGGSAFGPVKTVELVDPMTVRLRFDAPYAPLLEGLSGREIASPAAVMKYGEDFTNNPVGAGPFIVKKQVPGNSIEYDRNPDYAWAPAFYKNRGAAYLDGLTMRAIKEDATTWAALQAGEVHLGGIPTVYIKEAEMNPNITVHKRLDSGIRYLGFNCQKPPFNDQRVRQAISHAIDRPSIVSNALDGYGEVLYTPMASAIAYSDNAGMEKIAYKYDVAAAKAKMQEAGYDLSSGAAVKDGQPFETTLLVNNTDFFKRAGQIVQAQLKVIGIKVNIQITEGTALTDATVAGTHQMFLQLYGSSDPSIMYYFFHSSRIKATNRAWFSTPELDKLLDDGQAELDTAKQKEIYTKVQETVVKAAPWVTFCNPYVFTAIRKEVRGLAIHPQGGFLLHDAWLKK